MNPRQNYELGWEQKNTHINDALLFSHQLFGVTIGKYRQRIECCTNEYFYASFGRTVVNTQGDISSVLDYVLFIPHKDEPPILCTSNGDSSDDNDEEVITVRVRGSITSFDTDTKDYTISVSRGFGELIINAVGEVELELTDSFDNDEQLDDTEGIDLPPMDAVFTSDIEEYKKIKRLLSH